MIDTMSNDLNTRLADLEHRVERLSRSSGERPRHRDGRKAICARLGDEDVARVHQEAKRRGCTVSELVREALQPVIYPSSPTFPTPPRSATAVRPVPSVEPIARRGLADLSSLSQAVATNRQSSKSRPQPPAKPAGQGSGTGYMSDSIMRKST
jgi:hypothetical protein